jgi:hypothetical protein
MAGSSTCSSSPPSLASAPPNLDTLSLAEGRTTTPAGLRARYRSLRHTTSGRQVGTGGTGGEGKREEEGGEGGRGNGSGEW